VNRDRTEGLKSQGNISKKFLAELRDMGYECPIPGNTTGREHSGTTRKCLRKRE